MILQIYISAISGDITIFLLPYVTTGALPALKWAWALYIFFNKLLFIIKSDRDGIQIKHSMCSQFPHPHCLWSIRNSRSICSRKSELYSNEWHSWNNSVTMHMHIWLLCTWGYRYIQQDSHLLSQATLISWYQHAWCYFWEGQSSETSPKRDLKMCCNIVNFVRCGKR